MFHMKTASVRDLRLGFSRILARIEAGEEVVITMRRHAIARLVPWPKKKGPKRSMPDLTARLNKVFGSKIISDATMKAVMDQNKRAI